MNFRKLTISFTSALHHGSGYGISGLVDRAVLRDARGVPYLAGSAIKGKLRHATLRVLLADGKGACVSGDGDTWCAEPAACALCLLFGSPRRQGSLFFCDAYPTGDAGKLLEELTQLPRLGGLHRDSVTRARTSMDRKLGTVRPGLLFSTEALPGWMAFEAPLSGDFGTHLELLRRACHLITHFGADSSRGLGECVFSIGEEVAK